jgi:hypothetical protein
MGRQALSYAEVSILEAVARRARVDLVLRPVKPETAKWLQTHVLGVASPKALALSPPQTSRGDKVFVPEGWQLGMSFELGNLWLQARTKVLDHCQFPLRPTQRVDALVVERPNQILSTGRRRRPRQQVDLSGRVAATLWPGECVEAADFMRPYVGELVNWSEFGLGIRLPQDPALEVGTKAIIRLEKAGAAERYFVWAVLKHCTCDQEGSWIVGFGDVVTTGPGEAVSLMEFLAASPQSTRRG